MASATLTASIRSETNKQKSYLILEKKVPMASSQSQGALPQATRVLILAVVVGTVLLMVFKLIFPRVDVTQVLTVTGLISLLIAVGLQVAWTRFLKRRKHT